MAKKVTSKECYDEMVRLLRLYFYSKTDKEDNENILKSIKPILENLAEIEKQKLELQEQRRAAREAQKIGLKPLRGRYEF